MLYRAVEHLAASGGKHHATGDEQADIDFDEDEPHRAERMGEQFDIGGRHRNEDEAHDHAGDIGVAQPDLCGRIEKLGIVAGLVVKDRAIGDGVILVHGAHPALRSEHHHDQQRQDQGRPDIEAETQNLSCRIENRQVVERHCARQRACEEKENQDRGEERAEGGEVEHPLFEPIPAGRWARRRRFGKGGGISHGLPNWTSLFGGRGVGVPSVLSSITFRPHHIAG